VYNNDITRAITPENGTEVLKMFERLAHYTTVKYEGSTKSRNTFGTTYQYAEGRQVSDNEEMYNVVQI
jgi:hypothetical protein